jgi:hypothetical protein
VQSPTPSKWDKPQQVDSGGLTYHLTRIAYRTPPPNTMLQELQFDGNSLGLCQGVDKIGAAYEIDITWDDILLDKPKH